MERHFFALVCTEEAPRLVSSVGGLAEELLLPLDVSRGKLSSMLPRSARIRFDSEIGCQR